MSNEERFRQAIASLYAYAENPKNPLSGPEFAKLVDEMFVAKDALVEEQHRRS
jgi:hypothetical protein